MFSRPFPNPDHNHVDCKSKIMAYAERYCKTRGLRLTQLRRDVLLEVAENHKATGAYQILENLTKRGRDLAPISVYRSLDFLQMAGLIHRLDSINAYFACQRHLGGKEDNDDNIEGCDAADTLIFLICDECHLVGEVNGSDFHDFIQQLTGSLQFSAKNSQMEIRGVCRFCQEKAK